MAKKKVMSLYSVPPSPSVHLYCLPMQTLLSLSKLSLLAAKGGRADTSELDSALYRIEYQQHLPQDTLEVNIIDKIIIIIIQYLMLPCIGGWFGR